MNTYARYSGTKKEAEAFCGQYGAAVQGAAKPPSPWRRVITGIVGLPLAGFGLLLVASAASADDDLAGLAFFIFGVVFLVLGTPFVLATVVPFGTGRRVLVGLGAAVVWMAVAYFLPWARGPWLDRHWENLPGVIVLGAAGVFYLACRVAR
jgi:hypothetical protein